MLGHHSRKVRNLCSEVIFMKPSEERAIKVIGGFGLDKSTLKQKTEPNSIRFLPSIRKFELNFLKRTKPINPI